MIHDVPRRDLCDTYMIPWLVEIVKWWHHNSSRFDSVLYGSILRRDCQMDPLWDL